MKFVVKRVVSSFNSAVPLSNDFGLVLTTSNWYSNGNDRSQLLGILSLPAPLYLASLFTLFFLFSDLSKNFAGLLFYANSFVLPSEFVSRFKPSIVLWIGCFNISFVVGVKCLSLALHILFVQSLVCFSFPLETHFYLCVNYVIYFRSMIVQSYHLIFSFGVVLNLCVRIPLAIVF